MKPELREKIITYNKMIAEKAEKASDLDVIASEIMKLPPGQLKKVLSEKVIAVLEKYGICLSEEENYEENLY